MSRPATIRRMKTYLKRSKFIAATHPRYEVRLRAAGSVRAYRIALRMLAREVVA